MEIIWIFYEILSPFTIFLSCFTKDVYFSEHEICLT